jgi:predicted permease
MWRNYFTIAFRSLLRNKSYAVINVLGLALGITTCIIIFLLIKYELGYDKSFSKASQIYRIVRHATDASGLSKSSVTPYPLGPVLKNEFPDVLSTQFHFGFESLMTVDEDKKRVQNIVFADTSFFDVFDFEVVSGNPKKDLAQPGKIFLTEEFAQTLSKKDAKHLKLDNLLEFEIAGIIKKPKTPSHIEVNMVASRATLTPELAPKFLGFPMDQWGLNSAGFTYVVLPASMTKEKLESRFPPLIKKYYDKEDAARLSYHLQPLSDIHFNTEFDENPGAASVSSTNLIVLGFIGIFILMIACVNFVNLATALSMHRSREVGIRKTLGAKQRQLTFQYLGEAILLAAFAGLLSVVAVQIAMPLVASFLEKSILFNLWSDGYLQLFVVSVVLFTAVFSGAYPALVLSKLNPVQALKNKLNQQVQGSVPMRKLLVVVQFAIAQVLIICTLVVASQLDYFKNKSLGFTKDAVINVSLPDREDSKREAIRNKLLADSDIKDISFSLGAPTSSFNFGTGMFLTAKGSTDRYGVNIKPVDTHYKAVYGLQLVEGRWFTDSDEKIANVQENYEWVYVVNETAVKTLGFSSPKEIIGQSVTIGFNDKAGQVIGVVKDFNVASLHTAMKPVVMLPFHLAYNAGIKIATTNTPRVIKKIEEAFNSQYPEYLFEYTFLDDYLAKLYRDESKMFTMFEIFAGIAIFIGCLGLYGLASFMAEQKTKEIAIRKSLGASVAHIINLFSKEFIVLITIAFVVAAPTTWYFMNRWLQSFAFRIEINWLVFAVGVGATLLIAFATVGYRSLRAAAANPVEALKRD